MTKVFGIGLHKTGTTTLAECLRILGHNVCPEELAYLTRQEVVSGIYGTVLRMAKRYDAFEDSPWNYKNFYQTLDAVFPEAKFVLTVRSNDYRWFKSLLRWTALYDSGGTLNLTATVGTSVTTDNREAILAAYRAHNDGIVEYFAGQADKLVVLDWEAGDGWEQLCGFLGVPAPKLTLPHVLRYDPKMLEFVTTKAIPLEEAPAPAPAPPEETVAPAQPEEAPAPVIPPKEED